MGERGRAIEREKHEKRTSKMHSKLLPSPCSACVPPLTLRERRARRYFDALPKKTAEVVSLRAFKSRRRRQKQEPFLHRPGLVAAFVFSTSTSTPPKKTQIHSLQLYHQALPDALPHGRGPGGHQRRPGQHDRGRLALARVRHDQGERLARSES